MKFTNTKITKTQLHKHTHTQQQIKFVSCITQCHTHRQQFSFETPQINSMIFFTLSEIQPFRMEIFLFVGNKVKQDQEQEKERDERQRETERKRQRQSEKENKIHSGNRSTHNRTYSINSNCASKSSPNKSWSRCFKQQIFRQQQY